MRSWKFIALTALATLAMPAGAAPPILHAQPGAVALALEEQVGAVLINGQVPGGILLEPNTGLAINDFTASVEFFKSLPSIDDPFAVASRSVWMLIDAMVPGFPRAAQV